MARRAFVIGGTGQIGRAIAAKLMASGWQIVLSSRQKRDIPSDLAALGAEIAVLDRDMPGALAKALRRGADAVIDTVAYDRTHARQLLEVEDDVGAFVVISSASVYRDREGKTLEQASQNGFPNFPEPISESQPTVVPGPETYSTRKVELERWLLDHARRPVGIIRPCAVHGRHSLHPREWWFVKRMLDRRRTIPLAYRGESRFHTTAAANIAALITTALAKPDKCILNAADPEALTTREIGALIAHHMKYEGEILPIDLGDEPSAASIGRSPWSVPVPFVLDTSAAVSLGYTPETDYSQAVGASCDWLKHQSVEGWEHAFPVLASYSRPLFDYAAEDALLRRMGFSL